MNQLWKIGGSIACSVAAMTAGCGGNAFEAGDGSSQRGTGAGATTGLPGTGGAGGDAQGSGGSAQGNGGGGGSTTTGGTLDLAECGPDAFGTGIEPTLHSTLDSAEAITLPEVGELGFVGNAAGDYHGGMCGLAINIDQQGDFIKYHYQDNGVVHFDPVQGTLDFWYRPSYADEDGLEHHLFATANWDVAGGFRMRKADSNNANAFQVVVRSASLEVQQIEVPADAYEFVSGQWVRITLIWELDPSTPARQVRLYLDGQIAGALSVDPGFTMAPDPGGFFVLGIWTFGDAQHAAGLLDDVKVFPRGP